MKGSRTLLSLMVISLLMIHPCKAQGDEQAGVVNIFDSLWNIVEGSVNNIAQSIGNQPNQTNDVPEALGLFVDTAATIGNEIADYNSSNTRGQNTLGGVMGFFENLATAGGKTIGKSAEKIIANFVNDTWVQDKVTDTLSQGLGNVLNLNLTTHDDPKGKCEIEWNANYVGTLINDGHQTIVSNEGECCALCGSTSGCNTWVYCDRRTGCGAPYYKYGECYLKEQENPSQRNAYERGYDVYWTSGVLKSAIDGDDDFQKKSASSGGGSMDREVLYITGKPSTWIVDDETVVTHGGSDSSKTVEMKPAVLRCGNYNTLPGVSAFSEDYDMKLEVPKVSPNSKVLLLWSTGLGGSVLPRNYMGYPCGDIPLQLYVPINKYGVGIWDQQLSDSNADGVATFTLSGLSDCTKYVYQLVDLKTCKTSDILDTRMGL